MQRRFESEKALTTQQGNSEQENSEERTITRRSFLKGMAAVLVGAGLQGLNRWEKSAQAAWSDTSTLSELPTLVSMEASETGAQYYFFEAEIAGEQVEYAAEVKKYSSSAYPLLEKYYGSHLTGFHETGIQSQEDLAADEIVAISFMSDGAIPNEENQHQYGVTVYLNQASMPDGESIESITRKYAKHLFPQSVQAVMSVSGFDWWQKTNPEAVRAAEHPRRVTWAITPGMSDAAIISERLLGAPSASVGWRSEKITPSRNPSESMVVDILTHEVSHAVLLPFGSQMLQECLGRAAAIVYGLKMLEIGVLTKQTVYDYLYSIHLMPFAEVNRASEMVDGESVINLPYDVQFLFEYLFKHAAALGVSQENARVEVGAFRPEVMIELWQKFLEGSRYLFESVEVNRLSELFCSLYELNPGQSYGFLNSAIADRGLLLAIESYRMKAEGRTDFDQVVERLRQGPTAPLNQLLTEHAISLLAPAEGGFPSTLSRRVSNQFIETESRGLGSFQDIHLGDEAFYRLGVTSKQISGQRYPNLGYPIFKTYRIVSPTELDGRLELITTDQSRFVHLIIRDARADFCVSLSPDSPNETHVQIPQDGRKIYVMVFDALGEGVAADEEVIVPFLIQRTDHDRDHRLFTPLQIS